MKTLFCYLTNIKLLIIYYGNRVIKIILPFICLLGGFKNLRSFNFHNIDFTRVKENFKSINKYLYTLLGGVLTWKYKKINL